MQFDERAYVSYFGLLQPPPSSWMARKIQNYPILPGIILEDDVIW